MTAAFRQRGAVFPVLGLELPHRYPVTQLYLGPVLRRINVSWQIYTEFAVGNMALKS